MSESSYFIDVGNEAEVVRLARQAQLVSKSMGKNGLIPPEFVPGGKIKILDLACGPGTWALEVADQHPEASIIGVDIDELMIQYANAHAQAREQERVEFLVKDILKPLDFPDASFDFINARFCQGFMRTSSWSPLIRECFRLTKLGGVLRMTETAARSTPGSPHTQRIDQLLFQAFWQAQMSFGPTDLGVTPMLGRFFSEEGYQVVNEVAHVLNYSYSTEFHRIQLAAASVTQELVKPFLRKFHPTLPPEDIDTLCREVLQEMQKPGYREHWYLMSILGKKSA